MPEENTRQTTIPLARAGEPFHLGGCCEVETVKVARDWLREQISKKHIKLTKREQQIVTLLAEGKNHAEISHSLNITTDNVRKIVQRMRQKVR